MKNTIRRFFIILRAALGVGLLYYVLKLTGGWAAAKQLISAKWLLPWLSVLTLFGAAIEAKRLGVLFGAQGMRLSFVEGYRAVARHSTGLLRYVFRFRAATTMVLPLW